MKKTIKLACLLLVAVFTLSLFAGCGNNGKTPVSTTDTRIVMKLGGYNVTHDFYRYLFLNTKYFYDNGDESYWSKEGNDIEKIKDYVLGSLKETYAMFKLADEYKISLSDEDKEYVQALLEQSKIGYTDEEYKETLEKAYMTEELYTFILEVQRLELLVYNHITAEDTGIILADDKTVTKALKTDFVRASHILFTFDSQEKGEEQLKKANEILERLNNGEDFETLKQQYSEDDDTKNSKDGYYFTHGVFNNAFEETAFKLKEGEISEIVTTEYGYHIIKRLPIEQEYVDKNYSDILNQFITWKYYEILEDTIKDLKAEYTEEYKNIDFSTFK